MIEDETVMEDDATDAGEEFIKQLQAKKNVKEDNDDLIKDLLTSAGYDSPQKINSTGAFGTIFRIENTILKVLNYHNTMSSLRKILIKEYYLGRSVKEEGVRYYGLMYHDVKKSIVDIKRIIILSPKFVALEMKYYKFGDLRNLVSPKLSQPLSAHISRKVLKDVSKGLLKLKQSNIVHCDVKLENIFIEKLNQEEARIRVILGDFGVSTFGTDDENHLKGTVKYLSPEAQKEHDYSSKSDVYALGIVMKHLTQNDPLVNREFLDKMTHPIKSERYDIEDVRNNLDDFVIIKRTPLDEIIPVSAYDQPELRMSSIEVGNIRYSTVAHSSALEVIDLETGENSSQYIDDWKKIGNWIAARERGLYGGFSFILFIGRNSRNIFILFEASSTKAFAVFDLNFNVLQIIQYPKHVPKIILDITIQEETLSIKSNREWIEYPHLLWNSEMRETVFSTETKNYYNDDDFSHLRRELETHLTKHEEPHKSYADELQLLSNSPLKIDKLEKETPFGLHIHSFQLENFTPAGICIISKNYKIFEYIVNNNVYHYSDPTFHQALAKKKPVVAWEFLADYIVLISNLEMMIQTAERNQTLFEFLQNLLDALNYTPKGVFSSSFGVSLEFEHYNNDDEDC